MQDCGQKANDQRRQKVKDQNRPSKDYLTDCEKPEGKRLPDGMLLEPIPESKDEEELVNWYQTHEWNGD
jgi:hypothetical protein